MIMFWKKIILVFVQYLIVDVPAKTKTVDIILTYRLKFIIGTINIVPKSQIKILISSLHKFKYNIKKRQFYF